MIELVCPLGIHLRAYLPTRCVSNTSGKITIPICVTSNFAPGCLSGFRSRFTNSMDMVTLCCQPVHNLVGTKVDYDLLWLKALA